MDSGADLGKAWREMVHRYAAGTLVLLIAAMAFTSWRSPRPAVSRALATSLVLIVLVQALFGRLTITARLAPAVVTTHLLLGCLTLSLLMWAALSAFDRTIATGALNSVATSAMPVRGRRLAVVALGCLALQIALGGWTSSHYAAPACPDFPTCHGQWWPHAQWRAAFSSDAAGRTDSLSLAGLMAIHWMHRLGAIATTTLLVLAAIAGWKSHWRRRNPASVTVVAALTLQLTIGAALVVTGFPLWLGVAHTAGAVVLLLATVRLNYALRVGA